MKKLLGIVCIITLLFSCSALAEDTKEYTFQSIPWRSTSKEAVQMLIDGGFLPNEVVMDEGYVGARPFLEEHKKLKVYPNSYSEYDKVMISKSYSGSIIQKQIAGYDVNNIELSFGINGNETLLLIAQLRFNAANYEEGYTDLQSKLGTLYGDYEVAAYSFFETSVWMGENNTAIVLSKDSITESFFIAYGTLEARSILDECLENYVEPKNNVDNSNVSGL